VSEPGGEYLDHVTPRDGKGESIAKDLVAVCRERRFIPPVIGLDGCKVNTGVHKGVFRCFEREVGEPVQHVVCALHFNELPFHHMFSEVDGRTLGPESLEGPIGSKLGEDIWLEPLVAFQPVPGKVPNMPDSVLTDLSRDQLLAYRWGHAIQSGKVPDGLVTQTIGPMINVRWLTRAVRCLAMFARTKKPTKKYIRIILVH
jgi:hypothetical protein